MKFLRTAIFLVNHNVINKFCIVATRALANKWNKYARPLRTQRNNIGRNLSRAQMHTSYAEHSTAENRFSAKSLFMTSLL